MEQALGWYDCCNRGSIHVRTSKAVLARIPTSSPAQRAAAVKLTKPTGANLSQHFPACLFCKCVARGASDCPPRLGCAN